MVAKRKVTFHEEEPDYLLLGIVSPMKDYRLCWLLNHALDIELEKIDDISLNIKTKKKELCFSRFHFHEPITKADYYVLQNKCDGDQLLPEIKQADYIFFIKGSYYKEHADGIVEKLYQITEIQAVLRLQDNAIKTKQNILLFDDEKRGK
jgi:hypothetical protein